MDEVVSLAVSHGHHFLLLLARFGPPAAALPGALFPRALITLGVAAWFSAVLPARPVPHFPAALALNLLVGLVLWASFFAVGALWSALGNFWDMLRTPNPSYMEIPGSQEEGSTHAALLSLLGVVYFFSVQGPALLALAAGRQLEAIPLQAPWAFFADRNIAQALVESCRILAGGVLMLALPCVFVLLFLEYSLGLLSVLLPSMQPYFLMMPLRAFAAEVAFWLSIPWILQVLGELTLWGIQNVMVLS